jgi:hypothetical protein
MFDDRDWRVRYLVVDTGGLLKPHPVLLAAELLGRPASEERTVVACVEAERLAESPPVESHPPVSRGREDAMRAFFGLPPVHNPPAPDVDVWGEPVPSGAPAPVEEERRAVEEESSDPHLKSARSWLGYGVEGRGDRLGDVDDLLVEPGEAWRVRYVVVDTGRWLAGEHRLLATEWIRAISHDARHVRVDLDREQLRAAPDFATAEDIDHGAERSLFRHYGFERPD